MRFAQPGQLFEDLGITYIGVVPGHDLHALLETLERALVLPGPTIVHVRTHKGRGYRPAEADQIGFHGAALPPMTMVPAVDRKDGVHAMPTESMTDDAAPPAVAVQTPKKAPNYTALFAEELIEAARSDRRIVGITAGMPTGTGMSKFQAAFPDRMFDVGIAEQHSVTFATGLAMGGLRPVVALYSTFLQRAFDQTVHDVCQNDQPVLIAVDRAGLVGRGRDEPSGHVRAAGTAAAAEPDHRVTEGRAGASVARPDRARAGPSVRTPLSTRRRFRAPAGHARGPADRPRGGPSRGPRICCSSASDRSSRERRRPPKRSRPRAGPWGSSTPASRSPWTVS